MHAEHEQQDPTQNDTPPPSTPPPNPNGFTDPYSTLRKKDKTRTTIDVSSSARADIAAVYPKKGVLQTTINILLEKLRHELKRAGLSSYSPEEYERAIAGCHILLGGYQYHLKHPAGAPGLILPSVTPTTPAGGGSPTGRPARGRKPRKPVETIDRDERR